MTYPVGKVWAHCKGWMLGCSMCVLGGLNDVGVLKNEAQREFRTTYKYGMNLLLLDERQIKVSHFLELARNAWLGR